MNNITPAYPIHPGDILAEVIGHNLSTRTTETEIELNFAVVKIKHKVIRKEETEGKEQ